MIDIHAHLQFPDFDADRDEVISRAREAGVEKMIVVGTDLESSRAAVELAEKHEFLFTSVGVHPHECKEQRAGSREQEPQRVAALRELAKHPKVVAIGECGLDYFVRAHQGTTNNEQRTVGNEQGATNNEQGTGGEEQRTISDEQKHIQREGFLAQIGIAREAGLPMIIHTRPSAGAMDAYEDVYSVLQSESVNLKSEIFSDSKFVLHCYQGDTEITKKFLTLPNVFFSFAGNVTYPVKKALVSSKNDILEAVKLVPLEKLFVETDCPYLTPQEHRGTRNEPAYVLLTAAKVAEAKGVRIDELETDIGRRFTVIFSKK